MNSDPNSTNIAYQWQYYDFYYSGGNPKVIYRYYNHHITHKTVTHNGTTTVAITHKEQKNVTQGIMGVSLVSFGVTQIFEFIFDRPEKDTRKAKIKPEMKFVTKPDSVYLLAGIKY